jgi:hypothetical protein
MEEAPENGKESSNSTHTNEMNELNTILCQLRKHSLLSVANICVCVCVHMQERRSDLV